MADHDVTTRWTESDDDALRRALLSLRDDVQAVSQPDPGAVRLRGTSIRRRRYAGWGAGAVAAAAAIAVVVTVSGAIGGPNNGTLPGGATSSGHSAGSSLSRAATQADPLATGGILPPAGDWQQAARLPAAPIVISQRTLDGYTDLCALPLHGSLDVDDRVVTDAAKPDQTLVGIQRTFAYPTPTAAQTEAEKARNQADTSCPGPHTLTAVAASAVPSGAWAWKVVLDGQTGWVGLAQQGTGITYLEVPPNAAGADRVSQAGFGDLLATALARIGRYSVAATRTTGR